MGKNCTNNEQVMNSQNVTPKKNTISRELLAEYKKKGQIPPIFPAFSAQKFL
jgi:hypothetical protein